MSNSHEIDIVKEEIRTFLKKKNHDKKYEKGDMQRHYVNVVTEGKRIKNNQPTE